VTEKTKNEAVRERLCALSEAFASLSDTFYKLSDRFRRPDMLGIKQITESTFESGCEGCRNRDLCWGAQYSDTLEAVRCITAQLHTKGVADSSCLPDSFSQRCVRREGILGEVNARLSEMTEKIIKGERVGFFASNYDDITSILKDALSADGDEYESDSEAGRKIFDYLYEQGFHLNGVVVYGKRCRHVVVKGVSLSDKMSGKRSAQICKKLGEIVGVPLTDPVLEVGRDGAVMLLNSKPQYRARCAHGRLPAEKGGEKDEKMRADELYVDPFYNTGEELCGDATNAFITDSSYFYSLISDGMGSGAEAAFTSGVCSMFIEKMLSAGNKADITLRMLNNVIRSENMGCGSESSATVDLFELDLIDGSAAFLKSVAAPTYVARGETVYKINSRTMPVGIIKDADARVTKFDTERGDIIVMISDGCCPDSDDCPWLVEYLCRYASERQKVRDVSADEAESLKNMLLTLAIKNYPRDRERDDISVSVIIIE
jgi:stage II sporulation protein E